MTNNRQTYSDKNTSLYNMAVETLFHTISRLI